MTSALNAQRLHFQTFGYTVVPRLFAPDEVERYAGALVRLAERAGSGGAESPGAAPFVEQDPDLFYPLLDDNRLLDVVDGLLGEDSIYIGNVGGLVEDRPWHTDVAGILHDYCSMKTLFFSDPVSKGQGSLTILASSHTPEYSRDIDQAVRDGSFDIHSLEVPGKVEIESAPGDLIAVDHRLWRTSRGAANQPCRFFALEWAAFPRTGWEEIFLGGYRFFRRDILNKQVFTERLLRTAGPRRRQKIAKMYDIIADADSDTGFRFL